MDRAHVGVGQDLQWAGAGVVGELGLSVSVDPDGTGAMSSICHQGVEIFVYVDVFPRLYLDKRQISPVFNEYYLNQLFLSIVMLYQHDMFSI